MPYLYKGSKLLMSAQHSRVSKRVYGCLSVLLDCRMQLGALGGCSAYITHLANPSCLDLILMLYAKPEQNKIVVPICLQH